ncbi:MAG: hypothetical protein CM1200mP29_09700 [Verrucomicrobiota bacterium]|nr:MAG: hypothetical protein CM1200mP29_09700 [Verrucomicrobiota bacterium]
MTTKPIRTSGKTLVGDPSLVKVKSRLGPNGCPASTPIRSKLRPKGP